jgi:hypothetical protein
MADPDDTLPQQIAALGYPNAERIAKMLEHSRAHMKALSELVGLDSRSFKGYPGREWIDREQTMRLVPALRDHAMALTNMLREELLRADGVKTPDGGK